MTRERIGKQTLEERLPAILREQYKRDGLPSSHLPSWEYITANSRYSAEGLNNKSKEIFGQTLLDFLRDQGFGVLSSGQWPTDDDETIRSIEYYLDSLENKRGFEDDSIDSVESMINKAYEAIREEDLAVDLIDLGYVTSETDRIKNVQRMISILDYMDRELADGTMINYSRHLSEYYTIAKNNHPINYNPVEDATDEFNWERTKGDPQPVSASQITDLWNTLNELEECPVRGYDLPQWRLWMKMVIVFAVAVGPRSNEIEQLDIRTQLHLDDDPHVHYDERKNTRNFEGQVRVPIMTGVNYLRAYHDYIIETDRNGKLVPSPESESGCRTASTLNTWLHRLAKRANVRLADGSTPTYQNVRQFWKTHYKKALHENRKQIKFVSDEDEKKSYESDEEDYISDVENRRHVRELGREYFDDVLDLEELPEVLQEGLNQDEYTERQARVNEYSFST